VVLARRIVLYFDKGVIIVKTTIDRTAEFQSMDMRAMGGFASRGIVGHIKPGPYTLRGCLAEIIRRRVKKWKAARLK